MTQNFIFNAFVSGQPLTTAISLPSSNTVKISPLSDGEGVITFDSAIIQKPPQKIKVFSGGVQQGFFESRFS
jgi:hypothetical protein